MGEPGAPAKRTALGGGGWGSLEPQPSALSAHQGQFWLKMTVAGTIPKSCYTRYKVVLTDLIQDSNGILNIEKS